MGQDEPRGADEVGATGLPGVRRRRHLPAHPGLPDALKGNLPRIEELEATLREADEDAQSNKQS